MAIYKRSTVSTRQSASMRTEISELYECDYYAWTNDQAQALRERKISGLDWKNLAEEVEDLGKAERHRLESHLESLLMQLLKWVYQPHRRARSWHKSIREHRFRIQRVLRDNPSLRANLAPIFADAYEGARFSAENETVLDPSALPACCPWSPDDAMRSDFWPGASPKRKPQPRANRSGTNR